MYKCKGISVACSLFEVMSDKLHYFYFSWCFPALKSSILFILLFIILYISIFLFNIEVRMPTKAYCDFVALFFAIFFFGFYFFFDFFPSLLCLTLPFTIRHVSVSALCVCVCVCVCTACCVCVFFFFCVADEKPETFSGIEFDLKGKTSQRDVRIYRV